jgi:hypothetical protein
VAAVLGHTNVRTTRLHYDGTKVPPMVKVPIKLVHTEDQEEQPVTEGRMNPTIVALNHFGGPQRGSMQSAIGFPMSMSKGPQILTAKMEMWRSPMVITVKNTCSVSTPQHRPTRA